MRRLRRPWTRSLSGAQPDRTGSCCTIGDLTKKGQPRLVNLGFRSRATTYPVDRLSNTTPQLGPPSLLALHSPEAWICRHSLGDNADREGAGCEDGGRQFCRGTVTIWVSVVARRRNQRWKTGLTSHLTASPCVASSSCPVAAKLHPSSSNWCKGRIFLGQ